MKKNETSKKIELASRRTGMAFQRTRMSAERTLMSVIRTSLSLIMFGFTISQFFEKLKETELWKGSEAAPRNFGIALVALGIAMLVMGIIYHVQFMAALRHERKKMKHVKLIHAESKFPISLTLVTAVLLLIIGVLAFVSLIFNAGPFG